MKKTNEMIEVNVVETECFGDDELKCCICGSTMKRDYAHDPYPVRPESWYEENENRCCSDCNAQIVFPIRMHLGRDAVSRKFRRQLNKMSHQKLANFIKANHWSVPFPQ